MRRLLPVLITALLSSAAPAQELTVFAASSLTEAFEELALRFERQHGGVEVRLNFDGSSTLATQIAAGAPADVFASADETQMRMVVDEGLTEAEPQIFARNRLVLITAEGAGITRLEGLTDPGVLLVLAAPEVPVGSYARAALARMNEVYGADFAERVLANVVSEEANVRQLVLKVALGEADAAIVYVTDGAAAVAEGVHTLTIPEDLNVVGRYAITVSADAGSPELARAFVALVLSAEGQAILGAYGFQSAE